MKSQTPGYLIVPPATASKTGEYRIVAPGLRFLGRADSLNMAELMASLDRALASRGEEASS